MAMPEDSRSGKSYSRRQMIATSGLVGVMGLAGCSGDGGGDESTNGGNGDGTSTTGTPTSDASSSENVDIGILSAFTGEVGWFGENCRQGGEVALADIREAGGVDGVGELNLVSEDTASSGRQGLQAFQTLDAEGVIATYGTTSSVTLNIIDPINEAEVPTLHAGGTNQLNSIDSEWVWRSIPYDDVGSLAQATYMWDEGWEDVVIVHVNARGPQSFAESVSENFESMGGNVMNTFGINSQTDSYRPVVNRIQDLDPDVVSLSGGLDQAALFMSNYHDLGVEIPVCLSDDSSTPDIFEQASEEAMEGVIGQQVGSGPATDYFAERFQEVHGTEFTQLSNTAYDSVNIIALGLQQAEEISRSALVEQWGQEAENSITNPPGTEVKNFIEGKEELENGNAINYQGAATSMDYTENRNLLGSYEINEASNGEWTHVKTLNGVEMMEAQEE